MGVNKNEVGAILKTADILYIGPAKTNLFRFGISPNKMMDYMLASKPIISAIDAGNDMVKKAHCGYSVPAEDVEKIAMAIKTMVDTNQEDRLTMGRNGNTYVKRHHEYKVLSDKFINSIMS